MTKKYFFITLISFLCLSSSHGQRNNFNYLKGIAEINNNHVDSAIMNFTTAIKQGNVVPEFYLKRASCYIINENYTLANEDLNTANTITKDVASYELARVNALTGNFKDAILHLTNHLSSPYRRSESSIKLDPAFSAIEKEPTWTNLWRNEWYTNEEKIVAEINYLLKYDNYLSALTKASELVSVNENNYLGYYLRAKAYLGLNNTNKALKDLISATEKSPNAPESYLELGSIYEKTGDFANAESMYRKAIKIEPENINLLLTTAALNAKIKNDTRANRDIQEYLSYNATNSSGFLVAGKIYYEASNYMKALEYFNKILKTDQSDPEVFAERGKTYLKTKMYSYAINDFGMSLDLNPKQPEVYYYKAFARLYKGDKTGACGDWQKALNMGYKKAMEALMEHCD